VFILQKKKMNFGKFINKNEEFSQKINICSPFVSFLCL